MAGDDDRGAGGGGLAQRGVELVAAGGVEAGVGLVEQPQLGPAGHQAGQGGAPLLAGREPADRQHGEPAGRPSRSIAAATSASCRPDRRAPEADVLGDGEVEVEPVAVAEQADAPAHGGAVGRQVAAEHRPGPAGERDQPGAHPQQRRLAGAVRARGAARSRRRPRVSVDAGQRREPAEHGHGVVEVDDGRAVHRRATLPVPWHGTVPACRGGA